MEVFEAEAEGAADAELDEPDLEDGIGSREDALVGTGAINIFPQSRGGVSCAAGGSANLTVQPKAQIRPHYRAEVDVRITGVEKLLFEVGGSFSLGIHVEGAINSASSCNWSLTRAFPRGLPKYEFTTTVPVFGVPVILTHTIRPEAQLKVSWTGRVASMWADESIGFGFKVGVKYENGRWSRIGETTRERTSRSGSRARVHWSLAAKVSAGIKYEIKIYDGAGPTMSFGPFLEGKHSVEGCGYEDKLDIGLAASIGAVVDVPVVDYRLAEVSYSWDLFRANVYRKRGVFRDCAEARRAARRGYVRGGPFVDPLEDDYPLPETTTPDGGMDAGMDTGDAGVDAPVDSCESVTACGECNHQAGCDWCGAAGQCMDSSRESECGGGWQDSPSSCEPCDATSCGECATSGFCVWCPSIGCVNDSISSEFAMCGDDYVVNPGSCGT